MSRCPIPAALRRGVYGWDAVRLSDAYSTDELAAAIVEMSADPANANPEHARGSIYLLTPAARKRTEALAMAIFYRKQDAQRAQVAA